MALPVESPTGDFYGGHRPGNNLFAGSLVCLDAKTGKRVWHQQLVHHDIWDYDIASPPNVINITVNGKPIRAVAQVTKQSYLFVFDRVTGAPVWPIEERKVPPGDTPGEWYSPTQPHPTKPAPFDQQGVQEKDLIDFTLEPAGTRDLRHTAVVRCSRPQACEPRPSSAPCSFRVIRVPLSGRAPRGS